MTIFKIKLTQISLALGPNHSTTHCLCYILDTVFKHLELSSSYVEAVFADISKAFDNLDHQTVIDNARTLGVTDFVLRMVASFLYGREQCVVLANGDSSGFTLTSYRAPQGTKLGPLAFLIVFKQFFLPNFDNTFKFADDLTLLNLCQTSNTLGVKLDSLISNLNSDLDNFKLNLSIPKSSLMLFSFLKKYTPNQ